MPFSQKSRKYASVNHNRAKEGHANTADPTTHLKNALNRGRDVGNVAR